MSDERLQRLVTLSRDLGKEERGLAILGEGNTSADAADGSFWVKGSGCQLGSIDEGGFTRVRYDDALAVLDEPLGNAEVNQRLEAIRVDPAHKRPSVETFLHALCLTEGGAKWVGHTHTTSMLQILCSRLGAGPFIDGHVYPDVIVVCGRHVAVVPYIDPGLELARAVRDELVRFKAAHGSGPKLLLMVNHGPVALGQTAQEVFNILLMADKWAKVLVGTYALGGPCYLPTSEADRIDNRPDEDYRRRQLVS
jgi:rhamnose utilization protein RhaD (predicted bifunctional aldolase and dehydrogenase)